MFHKNMDIAGAGASAALTGPFHNEVWGGDYDGVYLVKACALKKVVDYARYYVDGFICLEPPPFPPPPSPTLLAAPATSTGAARRLLADDITNNTSPMDLYALRATCEEMVGCIGFKMQSTGCVHWILGKNTSSCAAASRRTPDPLWTPPESGAGYFMAGVDEAVVALADDAAPACAAAEAAAANATEAAAATVAATAAAAEAAKLASAAAAEAAATARAAADAATTAATEAAIEAAAAAATDNATFAATAREAADNATSAATEAVSVAAATAKAAADAATTAAAATAKRDKAAFEVEFSELQKRFQKTSNGAQLQSCHDEMGSAAAATAAATAEHASEVTIGVVATLSYTSPTLSVSLRGEFNYRTCDEYQARLVGKVAIMPAGGSSDVIAIFTVGATMGCATEHRTRVYRVFGTVSDFAVIAGVTIRTAVANATIAEYLNGSVALNGTCAGAAVIDGDVEGLEGFDLSDSYAITVSVDFAKRPGGCSSLRGCGCSSSWTSSTTTPTCPRRRWDPPGTPRHRAACSGTSAGTPTWAIAWCRRPSRAPAWPTCTCGAAPTSRTRARRASGKSSRRTSRCASTPSIWPGSSPL